jgi:hypothetical protein
VTQRSGRDGGREGANEVDFLPDGLFTDGWDSKHVRELEGWLRARKDSGMSRNVRAQGMCKVVDTEECIVIGWKVKETELQIFRTGEW